MKRLFFLLPLLLLLGGCGPRVPTVLAGSLEIYQGGKIVSMRQLTNEEVMAFAEWFVATPDGWKPHTGTVTPVTLVRLHHPDEAVSSLNILPASAILRNASGQFEKALSPQEATQLQAMIAGTKKRPL